MSEAQCDFAVVSSLATALPGVVEGTLHGAPSWKLRGKLMACAAIHKSAEPDTLLVKVAPDERDELLASAPETFYLTEHYENQPVVLVYLSQIDRATLKRLLKGAWEFLS